MDDKPNTRQEIEDVAERAAERAVQKMMLQMGMNVSSADDIIEAQRDNSYLRSLRIGSEKLRSHGMVVAVGAIITALMSLLYVGFQAMTNTPHPPG